MTLKVYYHADLMALLGNAEDDDAYNIIENNYHDYAIYLESQGVEVDTDNNQTSYCWSNGGKDWPEDILDFWAWYHK